MSVLLLLGYVSAQTFLFEGTPAPGSLLNPTGGEALYYFVPKLKFSVFVELRFSALLSPSLYLSRDSTPTRTSYMWTGVTWESGVAVIYAGETEAGVDHLVLVACNSPCHYNLTFTSSYISRLYEAFPYIVTLQRDHFYMFDGLRPDQSRLVITVVPFDLSARMQVVVGVETASPLPATSLPVEQVWPAGYRCTVNNAVRFRVLVRSLDDLTFQLSMLQPDEGLDLSNYHTVVKGTCAPASFTYYTLTLLDTDTLLLVQLTVFAGQPSIFLAYGARPALHSPNFGEFNRTALIYSPHLHAGRLYIGIYSLSQASYSIFVSNRLENWIKVYPGMQQTGESAYLSHTYYSLSPSFLSSDAAIVVEVNSMGDVCVYGKICYAFQFKHCSFKEADFAESEGKSLFSSCSTAGRVSITFPHDRTVCSLARYCNYLVLVHSSNPALASSYTLLAFYAASTSLSLGKSLFQSYSQGYRYYQCSVLKSYADSLTFQVTTISGSPILYLSRSSTRPTAEDFERSSYYNTVDTAVTYTRAGEGKRLEGVYYLSVFSESWAVFSLVVYEEGTGIGLDAGLPQQGSGGSRERIYRFEVNCREKLNITVAITQIYGEVRMCVGRLSDFPVFPWCTDYTNSTTLPNTVNISPEYANYCSNGSYIVLVKGPKTNPAAFTIALSTDNSLQYLQGSVPYTGQVELDQYRYFQFPLLPPYQATTVLATALSGSLDLYLLIGRSDVRPGKDQFHYKVSKQVLLQPETIAQHCSTPSQTPNCTVYLSVYGASKAVYSLIVTVQDRPGLLPLGKVLSAALNRAESTHYRSFWGSSEDGFVHLQTWEGRLSLSIQATDSLSSANRFQNSDFQSDPSLFSETIELNSDILQEKCKNGYCLLLFSVYCLANSCKYALSTSKTRIMPILEGIPLISSTERAIYRYFDFYNPGNSSIRINLTPISSTAPSLYANKGFSLPNEESSTWKLTSTQGNQLIIGPLLGNLQGNYVFAVKTLRNELFSLTVGLERTVLRINRAVPIQTEALDGEIRHFLYSNCCKSHLIVTLVPLTGSAVLRANAFPSDTGDISVYLPNKHESTWFLDTNYQNILLLPCKHSQICLNCSFAISVFSEKQYCSFSLTIASDEEAIWLQNGIPTIGQIEAFEWKYYLFSLAEKADWAISLLNYSGDTAIQVNTSLTDNWKRTSSRLGEYLAFSQSIAGMYRLGVYGKRNSTYSLTVSTGRSMIRLVAGGYQTFSFPPNSLNPVLFEYSVDNSAETRC